LQIHHDRTANNPLANPEREPRVARSPGGWSALVVVMMGLVYFSPLSAQSPIPLKATLLSVQSATVSEAADALRKAGIALDISALDPKTPCVVKLAKAPYWEALEAVAKASDARIEILDHGRRVSLVKRGAGKEASSLEGPFRIVTRQVNGRLDLATGNSFQELELLVHWEPRLPVFRIDSVPRVTLAKDDLGNAHSAGSASAFSPVSDASSHRLPVRVMNVPRKATAITELTGQVTVTASERMLPFAFAPLGGPFPIEGSLPRGVPAGSVRAVLTGWQLENINGRKFWEATLRLSYPAGMPVFESFETWLGENKLRLVTPQAVALAPDQIEEPQPGREMTAVYRFAAAKIAGQPNGPGWSLVYDTPSPLAEFKVPFTLKDIPLP